MEGDSAAAIVPRTQQPSVPHGATEVHLTTTLLSEKSGR